MGQPGKRTSVRAKRPMPAAGGVAAGQAADVGGDTPLAVLRALQLDVAGALEQQAATAEILRAISRSPGSAQPVFDIIAHAALQLCRAESANVFTFDGSLLHVAALAIRDPEARNRMQHMWPRLAAARDSGAGRAVMKAEVDFIPDVLEDREYGVKDVAVSAGFRSVVSVPLMLAGRPVGAIAVGRAKPGIFPQEQVALLKIFADQAVIAVENARLLHELEARNSELTKLLEQRTATSEILRVISSSPSDEQPVFQAIASAALRLCEAASANVVTFDGTLIHVAALAKTAMAADAVVKHFSTYPRPPSRGTANTRAILTRSVVAIPDVLADPDYTGAATAVAAGYRSVLSVPLLHGANAIGAITVARPDPGPFPDEQVNLLQTFADQAVIAIGNARLFQQLEDKSRQLEVASKHKSAFLANMSHELRTPLNAILGFSRIVMQRSREQLEPKQFENMEKIYASGQHLLTMINAVLDLAKIEAGRVEVTPVETDLPTVLEHCLRTVEPMIQESVTAVRGFSSDPLRIVVDEEKLRQIVFNLLSNAARFTAAGSICLGARVTDEAVIIDVTDTGTGIPADRMDAIFEEFEQVDSGSTRAHGGTGLGLAISRRLARLMGGDVNVTSTLGSGSCFTLSLPGRRTVTGR